MADTAGRNQCGGAARPVCNAQISLTQHWNKGESHKSVNIGQPMRHPAAALASRLPSIIMPCPVCAGRMAYHGCRAVGPDVEDTVYACKGCGAEVIRTAMRRPADGDERGAVAAA